MPVKAQTAGIIDHPLPRVFQFHAIEHVQNHPRWDPNIKLEQVTEGPMGVGTLINRINTRSGQPVDGTMEVVEFEADQAMTMVIHDGPVRMIARVTYEAEGEDRTRLDMNIEFPDLDEMETDVLVQGMQRSLRNVNQLLTDETQS